MEWSREDLPKESRQRRHGERDRGNTEDKESLSEKRLSGACGPRRMSPGRSKYPNCRMERRFQADDITSPGKALPPPLEPKGRTTAPSPERQLCLPDPSARVGRQGLRGVQEFWVGEQRAPVPRWQPGSSLRLAEPGVEAKVDVGGWPSGWPALAEEKGELGSSPQLCF